MLASADSLEAIYAITLIIVVGIGLQWIAWHYRLPALLLLLTAGITLGPVTGILNPTELVGDLLSPLISLSVAVVLFEGGLTLRFKETRIAGPVLWRLILSGLVVGSVLTAAFAYLVADLSIATAAVLGSILVVTGPTVILPMLRSAKIARRPATLLKWEGIVNDPLGALLAVLVFQVSLHAANDTGGVFWMVVALIAQSIGALLLGALLAWILGRALRSHALSETLVSPVMLAAVVLAYAAGETLGAENGLLAVTAMGLVLANLEDVYIDDIQHFKEQISVLLVSVLFIVLSARLQPEDLTVLLGPPILLVALILFVVRPIVALCASARSDLPWNERALIGWIAPRGIVAAAVAAAFTPKLQAAGYEDARMLVPIIFGVIVGTVVLHGLTLGPLARSFGLSAIEGKGILIVGAKTWNTSLARALDKAGASAILTGSRYERVSRARRAGVEAHYGDVLSEETAFDLPLERITWLLAATDDDAYNALVCTSFGRDLGKDRVLQLTPMVDHNRREERHSLMGQTPWGEAGTYKRVAERFWRRGEFKVTSLTNEFTWEQFREQHPEAFALFAVLDGKLRPLAHDDKVATGSKVVYLPSNEESAATEDDATPAATAP